MTAWLRRVEDLLESVDKQAAEQIEKIKSPQRSTAKTPKFSGKHDDIRKSLSANKPQLPARLATPLASSTPNKHARKARRETQKTKVVKDEDLFDFLNSPSSEIEEESKQVLNLKSSKRESNSENDSLPLPHSKQSPSPLKSAQSKPSRKTSKPLLEAIESLESNSENGKENLQSRWQQGIPEQDKEDETYLAQSQGDQSKSIENEISEFEGVSCSGSKNVENTRSDEEELPKVALQNKLLRSESKALNEEISQLSSRLRQTEDELEQTAEAFRQLQKDNYEKERQILKLLRSEDEFDAVISEKDSTIASLQVKIKQANNVITSRDGTIQTLQHAVKKLNEEKELLLASRDADHETFQKKEQSYEDMVEKFEQSKVSLKKELEEKLDDSEKRYMECCSALAQAQRSLEEKNDDVTRAQQQVKSLQKQLLLTKEDLQEYKKRAVQVLQDKDRIIEDLSSQLHGTPLSEQYQKFQNDVDELRQQNQLLSQEKSNLESKVSDLEAHIEMLCERHSTELSELELRCQTLEESREQATSTVSTLQHEIDTVSQEYAAYKKKMEKDSDTLIAHLNDTQEELRQLKRKMAEMSLVSTNQEELEHRLQVLTDRLIQKQAQIDTLTNENSALQMQVDALKKEKVHVPKDTLISVKREEFEDAVPQRRFKMASLATLAPSLQHRDTFMSKKVLHAANTVDSLSMEVGSLLRSSPILRLLLLAYIIGLHFWCIFVFHMGIEQHSLSDHTA